MRTITLPDSQRMKEVFNKPKSPLNLSVNSQECCYLCLSQCVLPSVLHVERFSVCQLVVIFVFPCPLE